MQDNKTDAEDNRIFRSSQLSEPETSWEDEFKRLPKELIHLTLDQAIGLKPFTKDEINWLIDQLNETAIFYGNGKYVVTNNYQDSTKIDYLLQTKYTQILYPFTHAGYNCIDYNLGKCESAELCFTNMTFMKNWMDG